MWTNVISDKIKIDDNFATIFWSAIIMQCRWNI